MRTVRSQRPHVRRSLTYPILLAACLSVVGCAATHSRSSTTSGEPAVAAIPSPERFVPVIRYGRYTLVELTPTIAQQDLLLQIVDVVMPDGVQASVGDAVRHVLLRSGYRLCDAPESNALNSLPLPAAHYRLGPLTLRDALLTLVGPGWRVDFDGIPREVCIAAAAPTPTIAPPRESSDDVHSAEAAGEDQQP